MKITILNGNPDPANRPFDGYLDKLAGLWTDKGHAVEALELRSLTIAYCTGCFGCWVKTPGECVAKDDSRQVRRSVIHSDLVVMASPVMMGFSSALLKKMTDKLLPNLHPYFMIDQGEIHHRPRYERYPKMGLLLEVSPDTDTEDLALIEELYRRLTLNMKCPLAFTRLTIDPLPEVAHEIDRL